MGSNQNSIHLKSFNGQNEVLIKTNTHIDCNIVAKGTRKRAKIELTVEPNKSYSKICQRFIQVLIGMLIYSKAILKQVFENYFFLISY